MQNANALNWFEIPASDINRAKNFYETIFDMDMGEVTEMMGMKMAMFPMVDGKVGGGLCESEMHNPSAEGTLVYLNCNEEGMDAVLDRVEEAGGSVAMPRTLITEEIGYMAFFVDSEGNKMGLHSNK